MCSSPILELERTGQCGIVTGYPLVLRACSLYSLLLQDYEY
jgi:hypothetical protein